MLKRNKKSANQKGFTLIEILIVIIIVGVLAGLSVPVYQAQVQRSYQQEALQALGALRESEMRYFAQNAGYTDDFADLDYNPNTATGGQVPRFAYTIPAAGGATFTLTATRNGTAGGDGSSTVSINEAGVLTKGGAYQ